MTFPKPIRTKLTGSNSHELLNRVRTRDGWRCRRCDSRQHLHVHHLIKRSKQRLDTTANLVTLCFECHELVERHRVVILGDDANGLLRFRDTREL